MATILAIGMLADPFDPDENSVRYCPGAILKQSPGQMSVLYELTIGFRGVILRLGVFHRVGNTQRTSG